MSITNVEELFRTRESIGALVIGHAEGNIDINGNPTEAYYGHEDPGNKKMNWGWCSDQGKGGGTVEGADKFCFEYTMRYLGKSRETMRENGFDLIRDFELLINTIDLRNQAAPAHYVRWLAEYRWLKENTTGMSQHELIAAARANSFVINGRNTATGLHKFCTGPSDGKGHKGNRYNITYWGCVYRDQLRRSEAINRMLTKHKDKLSGMVLDSTSSTVNNNSSSVASEAQNQLGLMSAGVKIGNFSFDPDKCNWRKDTNSNIRKIKVYPNCSISLVNSSNLSSSSSVLSSGNSILNSNSSNNGESNIQLESVDMSNLPNAKNKTISTPIGYTDPMPWPTTVLTSRFNPRRNGRWHPGTDLSGGGAGKDIVASKDGIVVTSLTSGHNGGFGLYVTVLHPDSLYTGYHHLHPSTIVVKKGQRVKQGEKLGGMGTTGFSTGPHLHFELRTTISPNDRSAPANTHYNPEKYVKAKWSKA